MVDKENSSSPPNTRGERGQALVEYALILTLVAIALAAAVAATGPAIGNIFSNVVCNLVEQQQNCQKNPDIALRGNPNSFWLTITAIATNPPKEVSFPTNPPQPPTSSPTPGPSPTPSPTVPSPTPSFTPTASVTPTEVDMAHDIPFYDPIDEPVWWRVNTSVYLGGRDWIGRYYPNTGLTGTPDATIKNGDMDDKGTHAWNIAFNWGNGGPSASALNQLVGWNTDNFSVRWTRDIDILGSTSQTINVTIRANGAFRMYVDGVLKWDQWGAYRTLDTTPIIGGQITLTPGAHTFEVDYRTTTGLSDIYVDIGQYKGNVRDDNGTTGNPPNCQWTHLNGTQANSVAWTWKESPDPTSAGFPPNMKCNLELRGWIDLSKSPAAFPSPVMSFWDAWDLAAGTTVTVQLAEYAPYVYSDNGTPADPTDDVVTAGSGPNWSAYPAITLHNGGKNYAWARSQVPIPAALKDKKITYRFTITSTGTAGTRRWYLDDIRVDNADPGKVFGVCNDKNTCNSYWNLENPSQASDFIASGRWALTADSTALGSALGWAVSGSAPGNNNGDNASYVKFGPEQPGTNTGNKYRIHSLEFNGTFSFPFNSDGSGGQPDFEGDDGYPQITFWQSYALAQGESLEIQYTRDAVDNVPDNWQTVYSLVAPLSASANISMTQFKVLLNTIPAWNTTPFRLRFALLVDESIELSPVGGWWLDEIVIDREGIPRFTNYPFCDTADGVFDPSAPGGYNARTIEQWLPSGQWGLTQPIDGISKAGGEKSFTDSPGGNYLSQDTSLRLQYPIDFNNDTPENLATWGGNKGEGFDGVNCSVSTGKKATRPILTFWQWRNLAASESVRIDISRVSHAASGTTAISPVSVWTYNYASRTRTQYAWERVEIDLDVAIQQATGGQTLAQLAANGDKYDDDFFIAIRLNALSDPATSDGVYVDNITINEYTEVSHKLWNTSTTVTPIAGGNAAGGGNGPRYVDDIDNPSDWWTRWQTGGKWDAGNPISEDWGSHSGLYAFTDSPPNNTSYDADTFSVLEMNKIIDLRGAKTTDSPTFYFWDHYVVGANAKIMLQVAVQDDYEMTGVTGYTKRNRQGYDYIYNWGSNTSYSSNSSWETIWSRGALTQVNTWVREQVDLRPYADNAATTTVNEGKRLKFRFVVDTLDVTTSPRDGWFVDDIRIEFRNPRIFTLPFYDPAQNTLNWVTEGLWGLAPDYFRGSGGGPAQFGPNNYNGYYFDCIQWMANPSRTAPQSGDLSQVACTPSNTNTFLNAITRTDAGTSSWIASRSQYPVLTESVAAINYDFGTTSRPTGAPAGSAGATWDDYYMGRWMRDISVLGGDYTFITTSDDGVRLRYETNPAGGAPAGWNIINNWTTHGRTVDMQTVHINAGNYQLILEWFESTGGAVIILQAGNNNFSFSDSPKPTVLSDPVMSVPNSNSSLMLDGLLSLAAPATGIFKPRLQYWTLFDLGSSNSANVEVSIDGGFTWVQNNLSNNCPTGVPSSWCQPSIWGSWTYLPPSNDWMIRSHDLSSALYVNRNIGLRFRLNTTSNIKDGWWITDIEVNS